MQKNVRKKEGSIGQAVARFKHGDHGRILPYIAMGLFAVALILLGWKGYQAAQEAKAQNDSLIDAFVKEPLVVEAAFSYEEGEKSSKLLSGEETTGLETTEVDDQGIADTGAGQKQDDEEQVVEDDTILIVIDPGHGGFDEGCSREGILEKDINLAIALLVRDKLVEKGYTVLLTREEDTSLSLAERVEFANSNRADVFISIHQNAYEQEDVKGIETWYSGRESVYEVDHFVSQNHTEADDTAMQDGIFDLAAAMDADRMQNSNRLARLLQQQVTRISDAADREVRDEADYFVTKNTYMPACLIETGFLSNNKEREALMTVTYQDKIATGIAEGIDLYFNPKTMYLTFDDGPSKENTNTVLDILKERNIKATFFVIGESVRRYPEVAKRIVEEGHTIAIHCNNHDYNQIYQSVESYLEDFQAAYDAIYEITGVEAKIFRFPGGSVNSYNKQVYKEIIEEMTSRGYIYFDWNASLQDATKNRNPQKLIENAVSTTHGRSKVVMLAHDVISDTVQCLPELLDLFPEYRMEPLTEDVEPVQFKH